MKIYLVGVRTVKGTYFSALIASADSCLVEWGAQLHEEYSQHLLARQSPSTLLIVGWADLLEVTRSCLSPVIWREFKLVGPEEVGRVFVMGNSATCILNACAF